MFREFTGLGFGEPPPRKDLGWRISDVWDLKVAVSVWEFPKIGDPNIVP